MAEIKDRIKRIAPYFKEMQVTTLQGMQVIYVIVNFPNKWVIDEDIESKFNVSVGRRGEDYFFCADVESGENVIFDAIEYNIEKMQEAIERSRLFEAKSKELSEIFTNESISLESLKTLRLVYDDNTASTDTPLLPKRGRKSKAKDLSEDIEVPDEKNMEIDE